MLRRIISVVVCASVFAVCCLGVARQVRAASINPQQLAIVKAQYTTVAVTNSTQALPGQAECYISASATNGAVSNVIFVGVRNIGGNGTNWVKITATTF